MNMKGNELIATKDGIKMFTYTGEKLFLPAVEDQWDWSEAKRSLWQLNNIYSNMTAEEAAQHFKTMINEGI